MIRRFFALLLTSLQLFSSGAFSGSRTFELLRQPQPPLTQDVRGTYPLADTVVYASQASNAVQARYTDGKRRAYAVQNGQMILLHTLKGTGKFATLTDLRSRAYVRGSFDAFYTANGRTRYAGFARGEARVNTIRLGLYAYETHVRDLDFGTNDFMLDKAFHVYGDKLYMQYSLYAKKPTTKLEAFGSEIGIPARTVSAVRACDANGVHEDLDGVQSDSVEWVGFDIRNVGVVGFILPTDGGRMTVAKQGGMYVLRQFAPYDAGIGINQYDETGGYDLNFVTFGCRIWTDTAHDFDALAAAAAQERHPLTTVTVDAGSANARLLGYNALRGTYDVGVDATDFTAAYNDPDRQYTAPICVTCDDTDRTVWLRVVGEWGGCLESAALLDENGALVPVAMQVNKNFRGDYGEPQPYYYTAKDYAYGESLSPLSLRAGQTLRCTVVHAYQNWGKVPLKQLSAIEFHTSYYHLSTGSTETNCIAPYFVYGRDGWLLPDFRGRSGDMWPEQPQFNSVGRLYFAQCRRGTKTQLSEYLGSRIDCVGQTYADVSLAYAADGGAFDYTLRHVEFPQTDENRTYYTVDIRFKRKATYADFRRDFDLFRIDGRFVTFDKMGYLNEANEPVRTDVPKGTAYKTLGADCPYYSFFSVSEDKREALEKRLGCSFGLIVRSSAVRIGGAENGVPLCLRTESKSDLTVGSLTLDAKALTFMPGDSIRLELVLLPWGTGLETHDDNVRAVREDSALHPVRVTAQTGSVIGDSILPHLRCENNEAQFTLTGGRGNTAVRVDGFTRADLPRIERQTADGWQRVSLSSANGYDGYTVHYNADGTYGFSFVYTAASPADAYTFRLASVPLAAE
ncbi:MAG: hypothetical protein IJT44_06795 [Clostridia bacterium]|nr:hypothetical protein [Clostridia bacterium]